MKTMYPSGYHHHGFVATHALEHVMYGSCVYIRFYVYIYGFMCIYTLSIRIAASNFDGERSKVFPTFFVGAVRLLLSNYSKAQGECLTSWLDEALYFKARGEYVKV